MSPAVFLLTQTAGVRSLLGDGDTGCHFRSGEWILAHRQFPYQGLFSFTMAGKPWSASLWDLGAAWICARRGGVVVLVNFAVICLTFALLYRLIARRSQNVLAGIGLTVLSAAGSTVHWLARPPLFTMLFTGNYLSILP